MLEQYKNELNPPCEEVDLKKTLKMDHILPEFEDVLQESY